jgi:hypothetical protein
VFSNTLTLTINAVAKVLNRVNQDSFGSSYRFISDLELITLTIRHDVVKRNGANVNRHNVYVERVIFATPTVAEKYWSYNITLRDALGSGPTELLYLAQACSTLFATLDDGLVVGEN